MRAADLKGCPSESITNSVVLVPDQRTRDVRLLRIIAVACCAVGLTLNIPAVDCNGSIGVCRKYSCNCAIYHDSTVPGGIGTVIAVRRINIIWRITNERYCRNYTSRINPACTVIFLDMDSEYMGFTNGIRTIRCDADRGIDVHLGSVITVAAGTIGFTLNGQTVCWD